MARRLKTHEEFMEDVKYFVGDSHTILGTYAGSKVKISVKHNACGRDYMVAPVELLRGKGCPYCAASFRKPHKKFVEEVKSLVEDEYTVIGEYVYSHNKLEMRHNICGNTYQVRPYVFLNGSRCPYCRPKKIKRRGRLHI